MVALVAGGSIVVGNLTDHPMLAQGGRHLPTAILEVGLTLVALGLAALGDPSTWIGRICAVGALGLASWTGWLRFDVGAWNHPERPPLPTAVALVAIGLGVVLRAAGRHRAAQAAALVGVLIGALAVVSILYGDNVAAVASSWYPGTAVSAPAALGLVGAGIAVVAGAHGGGLTAWLVSESPGRRTARRVLPWAVVVPVAIVGIARAAGATERLGEPRAWALTVVAVSVSAALLVAVAARVVDRLSVAAERGALAELRLATALRSARVAELARALALAGTTEEVARVTSSTAPGVLGARAASIGIVDLSTGTLRMHHGPDVPLDTSRRFATVPLDADLAVSAAARTGRPVLAGTEDDYRRRHPSSDPVSHDLGRGARAAIPLSDRGGSVLGALVLAWDGPVDFDDDARAVLDTMGELVARSLERARLRDELAEEAARTAELARLAEHLATAATTSDVVSDLAEHVTAPLGALVAAIGLIDRSTGRLERHYAPALRELGEALGPVGLDAPLPLVHAATTGETVVLTSLDDVAARFPESLLVHQAGGFAMSAHLPLRDREGRPFGALGIAWGEVVDLEGALGGMLATVTELAAQTLERAWLSDETQRLGERSAGLAGLAESLAVAADVEEVADAVARHAPVVVDGIDVRLERFAGLEAAELAGLDLPADGEVRLAAPAASHGEPTRAQATVRAADGRPLGLLHATWDAGSLRDAARRSALTTVSDVVGQTVERVELAGVEHRLVDELQERAIRPLPAMPGLTAVARYEPASRHLGMGGDWFEGLELGGGTFGLVVGDVVGHGTDAAVEMLQLSRVLSSLLAVGIPLEELFGRCDDAMGASTIYATAFVAVAEPAAELVHYVSAGHPPPVFTAPDGSAWLLDGGRHPMLGVRSTVARSAAVQLAPGSQLLVYTDGLVERRGESIGAGFERLRARCESLAGTAPDELVDRLVDDAIRDRSVEDDIAVVVLRAEDDGTVSMSGT